MCILPYFRDHFHWSTAFVQSEFYLHGLKIQSSIPEPFFSELLCYVTERPDFIWEISIQPFNVLLGFFIRKSSLGFYDRSTKPFVINLSLRIHLKNCRESQFILIWAKGTQPVWEPLGQHWDCSVHQVNRSGPINRFFVKLAAFCYIVWNVSDMNPNLISVFRQFFDRERVIKVFGIFRVYGECGDGSKVPSFSYLFICDHVRDIICGFLHFLWKPEGQSKFRHDWVDFGFVFPCLPQYLDHRTKRASVFCIVPPVNFHQYLIIGTGFSGSFRVHHDVKVDISAIWHNRRKASGYLKAANKLLPVSLKQPDHLPFRSESPSCRPRY